MFFAARTIDFVYIFQKCYSVDDTDYDDDNTLLMITRTSIMSTKVLTQVISVLTKMAAIQLRPLLLTEIS